MLTRLDPTTIPLDAPWRRWIVRRREDFFFFAGGLAALEPQLASLLLLGLASRRGGLAAIGWAQLTSLLLLGLSSLWLTAGLAVGIVLLAAPGKGSPVVTAARRRSALGRITEMPWNSQSRTSSMHFDRCSRHSEVMNFSGKWPHLSDVLRPGLYS